MRLGIFLVLMVTLNAYATQKKLNNEVAPSLDLEMSQVEKEARHIDSSDASIAISDSTSNSEIEGRDVGSDNTATANAKAEEIQKLAPNNLEARWNINLGMSQFETRHVNGQVPYTANGRGLEIELQRRILPSLFIGASYTSYHIQYNADSPDGNGYSSIYLNDQRANNNLISYFAEFRPIQLAFYNQSQAFAAIDAGVLNSMSGQNGDYSGFFYGFGIGFNFENKVGIRTNVRASENYKSIGSVALIGYF